MRKVKVFITILITILCIFLLKNISYGVSGSTVQWNRGDIEGVPNRYCGDHDAHFPKKGESSYRKDITFNQVEHIRIEGDKATNVKTGATVEGGNAGVTNIAMYTILSGQYTGQTGYGYWNSAGTGYSTTQLVLWGYINFWLDYVKVPLGLDARIGTGMDAVADLYRESNRGTVAFNRVMNAVINGMATGGTVDIYIYISGETTTSFQQVWEGELGGAGEGDSDLYMPSSNISIHKTDSVTGKSLSNVSFLIKHENYGYLTLKDQHIVDEPVVENDSLEWPVPGHYDIAYPYGVKRPLGSGSGNEGHGGVDVLAEPGTPIVAPADATVTEVHLEEGNTLTKVVDGVTYKTKSGDGYSIKLKFKISNGKTVYVKFLHLQEMPNFSVNDKVTKGQTIGYTGVTGASWAYPWEDCPAYYAPHVHIHYWKPDGGPGDFMDLFREDSIDAWEGNNVQRDWGYTQNKEDAYVFVTGADGVGRVDAKGTGILGGNYEAEEIANANGGYSANIGKITQFEFSANETKEVAISNVKDPEYQEPADSGEGEGTVTISGYVWEDEFTGKGNSSDGEFGGGSGGSSGGSSGGDKPMSGILVKWFMPDGREIARTTTGGDGYYEMTYISQYGSIIESIYPFEYAEDILTQLSNSYVEIEYNGLKYTTVASSSTGEWKSRATENEYGRTAVDGLFTDITKDSIEPSGIQTNYTKDPDTGQNVINEDNWEKFKVTADTKLVAQNLLGTWKENIDKNGRYEMLDEGAYEYGPAHGNNIKESEYAISNEFYTKWCHSQSKKLRGVYSEGSNWTKDTSASHLIGTVKYQKYEVIKEAYDVYKGTDSPILAGDVVAEDEIEHRPEEWGWKDYTENIYCDDENEAWDDPASWIKTVVSGWNDETHKYVSVEWKEMHYSPEVFTEKKDECEKYNHAEWGSYSSCYNHFKIKYVNFGLVKREQPDIALDSDINQVVVIMKGQQYTYKYGHRGIINAPIQASFSDDGKKYTRKINPSDVAYVADKNTTDLEIHVTYDIVVKNQSETLPLIAREIVNYYDANYELESVVDLDGEWKDTSKYGNSYSGGGYVAAYKEINEYIEPQSKSSVHKITFKIKDEVVKSLLSTREKDLFNTSEVNVFSTLYGENTICAERKTASEFSPSRVNTQYAGVDIDSIPGSVVPGAGPYEDDTDKAPVFVISLNDPKQLSGTVWEDSKDSSRGADERLGNGTREGSEAGVANVKVELISMSTGQVAELYSANGSSTPAVTYTDSNGNFTFTGVVVDGYVVRYTYGNDTSELSSATTINGNEINARNYKSTIVTQDPAKAALQGGNAYWHMGQQKNTSTALDLLEYRYDIPSINYDNFNDPHNMVAQGPYFDTKVEYTQEFVSEVNENGTKKDGTFPIGWDVFDFGIIERPREDITINKTIENLKITLSNGQVLTEGNPYNGNMSYVKALGQQVHSRNDYRSANEKQLYLEMDPELMQGAKIEILYAITVTNNSEIDYDYDYGESYYYYGEKGDLPLTTPTIDWVIDYMDPELTCVVGDDVTASQLASDSRYRDNHDLWEQIKPEGTKTTAEKVREKGWISDQTKNELNKSSYLVFITDAFKNVVRGTSKTINLFATKLLANQGDDYTFENHTEIVQINGKIAKTIDSTSNGRQNEKTYKPGDYIPSTLVRTTNSSDPGISRGTRRLHEQDDDSITVRITPPTGLLDNISIYIITGVVALLFLAIGIWVIKKKVLIR